ncbi:MAG: ribulose-phosphate 3-epimerase [Balneolaceae bacterium]
MEKPLPRLAPSILAADFSKLGEEIQQCKSAGVSWIHCDIMDGHFVPNISYGPFVVTAVRKSAPEMFLDVHLMIEEPDRYIDPFIDAGSNLVSVHYEACPHLHRTLQQIKQKGALAGVAINPATSTRLLEPILNVADLILVMSVNPGFGGQSFIENSFRKIEELVQMRKDAGADFLIEVDGGVSLENIQKLTEIGVDILVAGSTVFRSGKIPDRIRDLQKRADIGYGKLI